mmetsp:Transcript_26470/g.26720  ORF Transcript_26470/g.26720 Transcript_26470/m.26720 type:complete len:103 (-) Transcript_26470:391-699(-)
MSRTYWRILLSKAYVSYFAECYNTLHKDDTANLKTTLWIIFWVFTAVFTPALLSFVYSVARDPLTPEVLTSMWNSFKERLGYLGKSSNSKKKKTSKISRKSA